MELIIIGIIISLVLSLSVYPVGYITHKRYVLNALKKYNCHQVSIQRAPRGDRGGLKKFKLVRSGIITKRRMGYPTFFYKVHFRHKGNPYFAHCKVGITRGLVRTNMTVVFSPRLNELID